MSRQIYILLTVILMIPLISNAETTKVIDEGSRFISCDNGVVEDKKTGLKWIAGPDKDTDWYQTKSWMENLSDKDGCWRMPAVEELKTLYMEGAGTRNMNPLLETTGWWIWSVQAKAPSSALAFSFHVGNGFWSNRNDALNARSFAVCGQRIDIEEKHVEDTTGTGAIRRYISSDNGIVVDTMAVLEWVAGPDKNITLGKAKSWVKNLSVDGGGWRMPKINELKGLYQKGLGTCNITPLLKTSAAWVWSGENKSSYEAWVFNFKYGKKFLRYKDKSNGLRVFAVRSRR